MTTLIATSVIRGSTQGESHGGVYLIDLERERVRQTIDWNTVDIDWQGRGWDRGLRGVAFDGGDIYIAASDELFVFDQQFNRIESYRCAYLKHCHEIFRYQRRLYLTSTGFDSILAFDLDKKEFSWGLSLQQSSTDILGTAFSPAEKKGPLASNQLHLNSVFCNPQALYFSGLKTEGMYSYNGKNISQGVSLPLGTHNARPHRDGVLFNDTQGDVVRMVSRDGGERQFSVPKFESDKLTHQNFDDSRTARQGFGRGLCAISDNLIAAGSSPSTITLHDLDSMQTTLSINLSMDIRSSIHGLEVWPFDLPD